MSLGKAGRHRIGQDKTERLAFQRAALTRDSHLDQTQHVSGLAQTAMAQRPSSRLHFLSWKDAMDRMALKSRKRVIKATDGKMTTLSAKEDV